LLIFALLIYKLNNQTKTKMKKVILFACVSIFAVSTVFAQQTSGSAPAKKEEKQKTEMAPAKSEAEPAKSDEKKAAKKAPVKRVPAKKAEGEAK
jgi:uncharacterized protein (DUF2147 family)